MRSNGSAPFLVALLLATTVLGVARTQPRLAATVHEVKQREDVYLLPPPGVLRLATLGYVAATTDQLWAKLLVEHGIHWAEKRPFPDLNLYLDAIVGLEPDYELFYQFVDTLLCYRPIHGTEADARAARRYFEIGIKERAWDPKVWANYGQFIAFIAPSFLTSPDESEQWRRDGALAMAHAVELGGDVDLSRAAASMLSERGEREAAIRSLRNAYAVTDDEEERTQILAQLERLQTKAESAAQQEEEAARRKAEEHAVREVERQWRASFPFLSRTRFLLLGPISDPPACAGQGGTEPRRECAVDWTGSLSLSP